MFPWPQQAGMNRTESGDVRSYMASTKKPPAEVADALFPLWEVPELTVRDLGLVCVTHAEPQDHIRLPRPGEHPAFLVAVPKSYDGTSGGTPGRYLALWHEVRYGGQRWKTPTLKVRAEEGARIAKDLLTRKPSAPRKGEEPRTGGRAGATLGSELRGVPVGKDGYLLFVRSAGGAGGTYVRSRGVEIKTSEADIVAGVLKGLAESIRA